MKTSEKLRAEMICDVCQLLVNDLVRGRGGQAPASKGQAFGGPQNWEAKIRRCFTDAGCIAHCFGRLMCMRQQMQEIGILIEIGGQTDDHII